MAVELFKCWNCGKDIHNQLDENCFFWCDATCKSDAEKKEQEQKIKWEKSEAKNEKDLLAADRKTKAEPVPDTRINPKTGKMRRKSKKENVTQFVSTGKTTCGHCGEKGHNSRTCKIRSGNELLVKRAHVIAPSTKIMSSTKGKYRCGNCGDYGHNTRSCSK